MIFDPNEIVLVAKNERGSKKRLLVDDERIKYTRKKLLVEKPAKRKLIEPTE